MVDDYSDRVALGERIAGLVMRQQAALDARGVEQHRQPSPFGVPQLGIHVEERAEQILACRVVDDTHAHGRLAFAHRCGELHVAAQQVARHELGARMDGHDGRGRDGRWVDALGQGEQFEVVDGRGAHEHGVRPPAEERVPGHERDVACR